jgi:hypothetical protein
MNIRAKIFGTKAVEEVPLVPAKAPKGAKADTLNSVSVVREEFRRANMRDEDRHRLPDEQVRLTHKGKSHQVRLINLSGGGAMVEGSFSPMLWDRVDLHLGENGTIECAVRWIKADRVGFEFAHETRLDCSAGQRADLLREVIAKSFPEVELPALQAESQPEVRPDGSEQRTDRRHPLIWSGTIHYDFQSTAVRLRNVSETGAMIECSAPPPVGAEPLLELGQGIQAFATVAWVVGDSVGLRFSKPFDLSQLANTRPDVASNRWDRPNYLEPGAATDSPWDEQWGRMSLSELRQELEGFLKR